jgi:hypothetical protein
LRFGTKPQLELQPPAWQQRPGGHITDPEIQEKNMVTITGLGAAAAVLTAGLVVAAPADAAGSTTEHQRGVVLECTGSNRTHSAYVDLYENDKHGNVVQVVIDDDPQLAASREPADIWNAGQVRTQVTIQRKTARIVGTARKVGPRHHVHSVNDDAGNHIVADGFHRRLADHLTLRYDGHRIALSCSPAFFYSLEVTTTSMT